ncbi:hypothetical protein FACS1894163_07640 [Spirochaetia bacterium]|nr:hypothetical protein FACS1894163_07640 [Spirochaetia bacterium]
MNMITGELITLFNFLLPGFITSFLFYSLTAFPKKSEFEAVVIALIYTVIINMIVEIIGFIYHEIGIDIGKWAQLIKTVLPIITALFIGLLWSFLYNNDIIHKILRNKKIRITKKTSYPSEWYATFSETNTYVVLHLKDERRIQGHPLQWPNDPQQGHFVLERAKWLVVDKKGNTDTIPLPTVDKIMIDTINVEMVEFLKFKDELEGEQNEC